MTGVRSPAARPYLRLARHFESCLARHGDNHRGVDWPNLPDAIKRYRVMLDVVREVGEVTLLDFGCGTSQLLDHLTPPELENIRYSGLDISGKFIRVCRRKHPGVPYFCVDVLEDDAWPRFDYIVANGVYTERPGLSFDAMWDFFTRSLAAIFPHARSGVAFNVMSKHVDWEREDLFHVPYDRLADFLAKNLTRNFVFRNDYGLYEYTAYVYR